MKAYRLIALFLAIWAVIFAIACKNEAPPAPCPPCPAINQEAPASVMASAAIDTTALATCEKDKADLLAMNRRLSDRLKEQYARLPDTKSWSRLCLPDQADYSECLLK